MNKNVVIIPSAEAFGFHVHLGTMVQYLDLIHGTIDNDEKRTILYHNLHSLSIYFADIDLQKFYREAVVLIDGISVAWLLRLRGHFAGSCHRVPWIDFFWPLMERAAQQKWRVYYLGSDEATLRVALTRVAARFPELAVRGRHGFFDATPGRLDNDTIVNEINNFATDLCLVGMGTPRQERWVAAHRPLLNAPVILTCGACMEYVAGAAAVPPRWLGPLGLEWSYRLLGDPRRFAHRYLVEPWLLLGLLLGTNLWRWRKRGQDGEHRP